MENNKSLALVITEQKQQISQVINNSKLEPVIWHYVLKDLLEEVDAITNNLLKQEQQSQIKVEEDLNGGSKEN